MNTLASNSFEAALVLKCAVQLLVFIDGEK